MENLRSEVVKNMRSCLNSSQDAVCSAVSIRQLNGDYNCLIGESIPFHKLGFKSLLDLIKSAPNEFSLSKNGNEWFVRATKSHKSAHITNMVLKQKRSKKRPRVPSFQTSSASCGSKWRPPRSHLASRYRKPERFNNEQYGRRGPNVVYRRSSVVSDQGLPERSNYQTQPRRPATAPTQSSRSRNTPQDSSTVLERVVAPERSNYQNQPNMSGATSSQTSSYDSNAATPVERLDLRQRLNKIRVSKLTEAPVNNDSLQDVPSTSSNGVSDMSDMPSTSSISLTLPAKSSEFKRTDDPLTDLKLFAKVHKLGEVTVTIARFKQQGKIRYSCKIKVGAKLSYSSYPKDFLNPLEAQNFCCEEAFKSLIPKCNRKSMMVASENDLLERIPPMLVNHPNGIWASQLEHMFAEKYNELLPDDWLKTIDTSPSVLIEKISNDYVLYYCETGNEGQLRNTAVQVSNVTVPPNMIQFETEGELIAQITYVASAAEIWCQQIGTEDADNFLRMIDRLQVYYEEHKHLLVPENISAGGYYVARTEDYYFRVRVLGVNEDRVDCFLIDMGIDCILPISDVFELKEEYANIPARAFACRLYGLEEFYEASVDSPCVLGLLDKIVFIVFAEDAGNVGTNEALPVYLHDYETSQLINDALVPRIHLEMAYPYLSKSTVTNQVYVSNIEPNGVVYIQVRSQGYANFLSLKEKIEREINHNPPRECDVTKLNSEEKLYFFKQSVDESWSRIMFLDWSPDETYAQIYFVDEGHTRIIKVANEIFYPLETLDYLFSKYPHQAVKVILELEQIPTDFVDVARKIMPKETPMMLRIVKKEEDEIPIVKLFRRLDDETLICINASLSLNLEFQQVENSQSQSRLKHLQLTGSSAVVLKCPRLPEIENTFEVEVCFAVSPFNFFVSPAASKDKLNKMMDRLQERYKDVQDGNLKVEDIIIGNAYASKNEDGFWFRTTVKKVTQSGSVSVCYSDYGYYQTINVKQMIPLDSEFMDLPYQAIKATLTGIKPIQSKWTKDDCERFSELVHKKTFLAFLENVGKDDLYENDLVLEIKLIDTPSEDCILYIHDELVKQGIAAKDDRFL